MKETNVVRSKSVISELCDSGFLRNYDREINTYYDKNQSAFYPRQLFTGLIPLQLPKRQELFTMAFKGSKLNQCLNTNNIPPIGGRYETIRVSWEQYIFFVGLTKGCLETIIERLAVADGHFPILQTTYKTPDNRQYYIVLYDSEAIMTPLSFN